MDFKKMNDFKIIDFTKNLLMDFQKIHLVMELPTDTKFHY